MTTYKTALPAVTAWCQANPGKACRITERQLHLMDETLRSLSCWCSHTGLMLVHREEFEVVELFAPLEND